MAKQHGIFNPKALEIGRNFLRERFSRAGVDVSFIDGSPPDEMSPVPGMDRNTYKNYLDRALNGDENVPAAFMHFLRTMKSDEENAKEKRETKTWMDFLLGLVLEENLRQINDFVRQYEEMAEWYRDQAENVRQDMLDIEGLIHKNMTFIDSVDAVFEKQLKTSILDRKEALRLLQQRGVAVDEKASDDHIQALLLQERRSAYNQNLELTHKLEELESQREEYLRKQRESEEGAEKLRHNRDEISRALGKENLTAEEKESLAQRLEKMYQEVRVGVVYDSAILESDKRKANEMASVAQAKSVSEQVKVSTDDPLMSLQFNAIASQTAEEKVENKASPLPTLSKQNAGPSNF